MLIYRLIGGRDGSTVLGSTKQLLYPGEYNLHHHRVNIKGWGWAHQNMLDQHLWDNVIPHQMKSLPIPLAGHCVVDIRLV